MTSMDAVIGLVWKPAVVAGFTVLLLWLARGRSAAQRSFLAHIGLLSLVALPLATLLLPRWSPLPADASPTIGTSPTQAGWIAQYEPSLLEASTPALRASAQPSSATLALWAYLTPALLLLCILLVAVARLFAMRRRAVVITDAPWLAALALAQRRMGFKHGTALLASEELRSPISWGVLRPTIVLDPAAVAATGEAEAIIAHELAHVARLDWAKLLLARLACALFWFNPLVWMLARESHQLREEAADDAVLLSDVDGTDYAALLVNAARHDNAALLIAAHGVAPGRSSLKRRIARVLNHDLSRAPTGAGWAALCLGGLLGVAGPLAAFGPARSTASEPTSAAISQLVVDGHSAEATRSTPPRATMLTADELVEMRATGVTLDDIRRLRGPAGTPPPGPRDIVAAKATGVDGEYADRLRVRHGPVPLDDVVAARAVGVDPDYAGRLSTVFPGIRLSEVVAARAVGVTPEYASSMLARFPKASLRDIVRMRAVGVSDGYVRRMDQAAKPSSVEVHGTGGSVRVETRAAGGAVARVMRGRHTITAEADEADPLESPEPPEQD